ncbi:MAG: hypothetical protein JWO89_3122 [Verrucomicrobiaceae bacterium]|nr:hypothetical protein [Verrucomicrobiaceae bacterium]MDB6119568.1 hypothetical protein [Verrucomicrobiaceae bacterium]
MKLKQNAFARLALLAVAAGSLSTAAFAGTTSAKSTAAVTPAPEEPFVTGNVTVMYETHFISYGQDVWGVGNDWGEAFVHPSIELDFNLGGGLQFYLNTWADINDQGVTTIGKNVQEVDLNAGFYYTTGNWKFQLGYGAWCYGSQVESVVDAKVSYTSTLNPFLAIHGRVADEIPFDTGVVGQIGIAPGTKLGAVALSFPVTVSFDTDNFHGGDAGFAYVSAGVSASIPLTKHVSAIVAATYYHTNDSVIPNPDSDFVVGSAGLTVAF